MLTDEYTRENAPHRRIVKEVVVDAPAEDVWRAWTTVEGVESFFAPKADIALVQGGSYELYFDPDAPEGDRGSEGCEVIGYNAPERLSFSWTAPPEFPNARRKHTTVDVHLEQVERGKTLVTLTHYDWHDKEGEEWDRAYEFFETAWDGVLNNLQYRFAHGPINWGEVGNSNTGG